MKSVNKKLACLIIVFFVIILLLSGCSSNTSSRGKGSDTAKPTSKITMDPAAFLKGLEKGKLNILSKGDFDKYFSIKLDGSYYGNTARISYSVKPESKVNIEDSSDSIDVHYDINIYLHEHDHNEIASKKITLILLKEDKYIASGEVTIDLPSGNYDELYWDHECVYCSGSVYTH